MTPMEREVDPTLCYWGKEYKDKYEATAWRIILAMPDPIQAYAALIFDIIFTESTPSKGNLLRSAEKAYTRRQLMLLSGVKTAEGERWWLEGFRALKDEGLIHVERNGDIKLDLPERFFGKETADALRKYENRKRKDNLPDEIEGIKNDRRGHCPDNVHEKSGQCPDKKIPPNNDLNNPPKSLDTTPGGGQCPENGRVAEFVSTYPKTGDEIAVAEEISKLSEAEFQALMFAARKIAADPHMREQKGRYCKKPSGWIRSRPWSAEDMANGEIMVDNQRLNAKKGDKR